jgi:predicted ribonuclease YlaK
MTKPKKIFVLDTNVLIHDPTALLRFNEHDIYLPIVVLEELDAAKIGMSEVARNVRQVSRFLDEVVSYPRLRPAHKQDACTSTPMRSGASCRKESRLKARTTCSWG